MFFDAAGTCWPGAYITDVCEGVLHVERFAVMQWFVARAMDINRTRVQILGLAGVTGLLDLLGQLGHPCFPACR